jgi:hypothetical protein
MPQQDSLGKEDFDREPREPREQKTKPRSAGLVYFAVQFDTKTIRPLMELATTELKKF